MFHTVCTVALYNEDIDFGKSSQISCLSTVPVFLVYLTSHRGGNMSYLSEILYYQEIRREFVSFHATLGSEKSRRWEALHSSAWWEYRPNLINMQEAKQNVTKRLEYISAEM